jgi:hypothetical protein
VARRRENSNKEVVKKEGDETLNEVGRKKHR